MEKESQDVLASALELADGLAEIEGVVRRGAPVEPAKEALDKWRERLAETLADKVSGENTSRLQALLTPDEPGGLTPRASLLNELIPTQRHLRALIDGIRKATDG